MADHTKIRHALSPRFLVVRDQSVTRAARVRRLRRAFRADGEQGQGLAKQGSDAAQQGWNGHDVQRAEQQHVAAERAQERRTRARDVQRRCSEARYSKVDGTGQREERGDGVGAYVQKPLPRSDGKLTFVFCFFLLAQDAHPS